MTEMITNGLMELLLPTAGTVLASLTSYGIAVGISYIKKLYTKAVLETEKIESEKDREYVQNILSDVEVALTTAAKSMEETMVPALKAVTADGKLTAEDQVTVFNAAKELACKLMGTTTLKLLGDIVDDTETYLNAKLQEILNNMKASGNNITYKPKVTSEAESLNS